MEEENKQQPIEPVEPANPMPSLVISGDANSSSLIPESKKPKQSRKKLALLIAAVILVLSGAALAFFMTRDKDEEPEAAESSTVMSSMGVAPTIIDGGATYKTADADWQALTTETELSEGMFISTDAGGRVVLTFDDGSALRLDESTIVHLVSLSADDIRVEQTAGTAYSRVVASNRSYSVQVADTNYTALGTAFTTVNEPSGKGVQVLQSSVKVDGQDNPVSEGKQFFTEHSDTDKEKKQTDIDIDELKSDGFMLWNLEQDEKSSLFKDKLGVWEKVKDETDEETEDETPEQPSGTNIRLMAVNNTKGTVLTWTVSSVDVSNGFKIVRSKHSSLPTFGKDEAVYIDNAGTRNFTWSSNTEGTYWYRICAYHPDQGSCTSYSNAVQMKAVYIAPEKVVHGSIILNINEDNQLKWTITGTAPYGYKVLISSSPQPTYPDNSVEYTGSTSYQLKSSQLSDGMNYVRVCKYTNGSESQKCVAYSNEIQVVK